MRTRAYRRHQRERTIAKHMRYLRASPWHGNHVPRDIAVRHPADCGRRCFLCHSDKLMDNRRLQEHREWMRDWDWADRARA
jgi:hypothetical protein